jgi:sigma-B regulation protein RsbU (phosphoserine phosphatase)
MGDPGPDAAGTSTLIGVVRDHPTFAPLSEATVAELVSRGTVVAFAPGQPLVTQGEASDAAFLLIAGEVEVVVESSYGPVQLAVLPSHSLIGDLGIFASLPRTATVRARSPVQALRMARDDILRIGRDNPALLLSIIGQLGQRLNTINQAVGFYTNALAALERQDFDPAILDELLNPVPELVDFAQTFRKMAEQIILRRTQREEMANAAAIQRAMLPPALAPESCGGRVQIHAEMRPAREVGGDFYDYFPIDERRLAMVIGDVSGKGVPASLFMAMTRTVIRLVSREGVDLAGGISRANELLSAENASAMFVTLFYGVLDVMDGTLTYCNCGHNPPFVLRADGGSEALRRTGLPLALMPDARYSMRSVTLAPGERVLLYTDGVTEASRSDDSEFGEARLMEAIEALRHGSARELVDGIMRRLDDYAAGAPQFDDITCLALLYRP